MKLTRDEINNAWPSPGEVMDTRSLTTRQLPQDLFSAALHRHAGIALRARGAVLVAQFHLRGRRRDQHRPDSGHAAARHQHRQVVVGAELLRRLHPRAARQRRPARQGSYFLTTAGAGSHNIVFGYDGFNDKVTSDNFQSATNFHVWSTDIVVDNNVVYPVIDNQRNTYIIWWPLTEASRGTNFRTHSFFANDDWQFNRNFTFQPRLAVDTNRGQGRLRKPRRQRQHRQPACWHDVRFPNGRWQWVFNASYGATSRRSPTTSPAARHRAERRRSSPTSTRVRRSIPALGSLVSSDAALRRYSTGSTLTAGTSRAPFLHQHPRAGVAGQRLTLEFARTADEFAARRLASDRRARRGPR
jgi:hypothetical protein